MSTGSIGKHPTPERILLNLPLMIHSFDKTEPDCSSTVSTMDAEHIGLRLLADHLSVTSHLIATREREWTSFKPKIGLQ